MHFGIEMLIFWCAVLIIIIGVTFYAYCGLQFLEGYLWGIIFTWFLYAIIHAVIKYYY